MDSLQDLAQEIATLSAHLDAASHRLLECIRGFDEAGGWHEQGAVSCAHWLAWRLGWDPATAREKVRVARALGKLPAIDQALRSARLSYAKVRALTRVATADNEARLLEMALVATAAQLEQLCRGYRAAVDGERAPAAQERSVSVRQLPGGMVKLELVLEPDEADLILRAVERAREVHAERAEAELPGAPVAAEISAWPSRADGAVKLAESFLAGNPVTGNGGERFQVMVHLDQDVLGPDGAMAATLEDGTGVSAEAFRRIACDCGLVAVGGDGQALSIGRRARSVPPAIRRALMLRDRGCAFPGCTHTSFLHAHHVRHWLHGGETSLANTQLLCSFHHRLVHEGGWAVAATADGGFVFHLPAGPSLPHEPLREVIGDGPDWIHEWADDHNLDLGPDVNMPLWDGTRPDHVHAVGCLVAEEQ